MRTDTEGIIFRQIKTAYGRRMVLLFSQKYGKISAGTGLSEKTKGKGNSGLNPFTYGRYELYKGRDSYNVNGAEVIKTYYKIGENIDKFMSCSYVLELTDKILPEDLPSPKLFRLLLEFLEIMEERETKHETLVLAYEIKALQLLGTLPLISSCVSCGSDKDLLYFSVENGGILCAKCRNNLGDFGNETLIYDINFGIVEVLKFFSDNPLKSLERLALDESLFKKVHGLIRAYVSYHLDVGRLKSEEFLIDLK